MLKIQQLLRQQMEAIKNKITTMEGEDAPVAEPYDSASMEDGPNVDTLIDQIRKLNFFTGINFCWHYLLGVVYKHAIS